MNQFSDIRAERVGAHIMRLTLNRPESRNALRSQTLAEIASALEAAEADAAIRAVVLTGGPKVFAAGADINELAAHDAVSIQGDARPKYWAAIRRFPKPIVAAVNGFCLGGGCELAMHADIIIAGLDAKFGQPEINLGIIPGAGGTQRLTWAVGKALAMRMVLTGEMIDAQTALAHGLVAEACQPELTLERVQALAEAIAAKPPLAVRAAKEAVLKSFESGLEAGLMHERKCFAALFATADFREGVAAFREKRRAQFQGL
ncbi:enoyl-CoA hydratase-related protein [Magnetospirillum sp. 64-120]|uniref:enoyl-CoA hydratase-related protein n=1 Tax=Magnetospirillum sp. 64-120 TaxID=1895778 RepID=UPI0009278020|nr:enoyl-CoA hydratase-related protein [Magnetospirillum sp. 64-120]OJX81825.1 MAG: 2,3-dehydroadipyl-CoA hydratase [Magnetospirillum sp. 64-120]